MVTLDPIAPDALIVGIDPATIHLGLAAMRIVDATASTLLTLNAPKRRPVAERLDLLADALASELSRIQASGTLVAVALEEPSDDFAADHHHTAFVLGRAFERCWVIARTLQVPVYSVAPAEASTAVGCARSASKQTRGKAVLGLLGTTGAHIGPDACDAYAVATAGYGRWQLARLHTAARAAATATPNKPITKRKR